MKDLEQTRAEIASTRDSEAKLADKVRCIEGELDTLRASSAAELAEERTKVDSARKAVTQFSEEVIAKISALKNGQALARSGIAELLGEVTREFQASGERLRVVFDEQSGFVASLMSDRE
jgi:hypothetical protein